LRNFLEAKLAGASERAGEHPYINDKPALNIVSNRLNFYTLISSFSSERITI
jgi:hypothetical protein